MFDVLFVGKIFRENIYLIKINIGFLWGVFFNFKNLYYFMLIKIRMLKVIIRKVNKNVLCGWLVCGKKLIF